MSLEERLFERIATEFVNVDRTDVIELLTSYSGPEPERVRWDILELSKGKLEKVRHNAEAARVDYRDILYWAEYFANDPMMRGRDPKQFVAELLNKWGKKETM